MAKNIEKHIPFLMEALTRNKGILDIWMADKLFGFQLVSLVIEKKLVTKKTIVLNAKDPVPLRIECITLNWDGKEPRWLNRYREKQ